MKILTMPRDSLKETCFGLKTKTANWKNLIILAIWKINQCLVNTFVGCLFFHYVVFYDITVAITSICCKKQCLMCCSKTEIGPGSSPSDLHHREKFRV